MKIIIVGKGGSGKDFLKKKLLDRGLISCVSHTTRPPRDGEVNYIDYNFLSKEKFFALIDADFFHEFDEFNGWYYGISRYQWGSSNVFIKTPFGISKILPEERKGCFVIYLDIGHNIRYDRLAKRMDSDNVERRMRADKNDFKDFTDFDLRITNPDF